MNKKPIRVLEGLLGVGLILFSVYAAVILWGFSPLAEIFFALGAKPVEQTIPWHLVQIFVPLLAGALLVRRALTKK